MFQLLAVLFHLVLHQDERSCVTRVAHVSLLLRRALLHLSRVVRLVKLRKLRRRILTGGWSIPVRLRHDLILLDDDLLLLTPLTCIGAHAERACCSRI